MPVLFSLIDMYIMFSSLIMCSIVATLMNLVLLPQLVGRRASPSGSTLDVTVGGFGWFTVYGVHVCCLDARGDVLFSCFARRIAIRWAAAGGKLADVVADGLVVYKNVGFGSHLDAATGKARHRPRGRGRDALDVGSDEGLGKSQAPGHEDGAASLLSNGRGSFGGGDDAVDQGFPRRRKGGWLRTTTRVLSKLLLGVLSRSTRIVLGEVWLIGGVSSEEVNNIPARCRGLRTHVGLAVCIGDAIIVPDRSDDAHLAGADAIGQIHFSVHAWNIGGSYIEWAVHRNSGGREDEAKVSVKGSSPRSRRSAKRGNQNSGGQVGSEAYRATRKDGASVPNLEALLNVGRAKDTLSEGGLKEVSVNFSKGVCVAWHLGAIKAMSLLYEGSLKPSDGRLKLDVGSSWVSLFDHRSDNASLCTLQAIHALLGAIKRAKLCEWHGNASRISGLGAPGDGRAKDGPPSRGGVGALGREEFGWASPVAASDKVGEYGDGKRRERGEAELRDSVRQVWLGLRDRVHSVLPSIIEVRMRRVVCGGFLDKVRGEAENIGKKRKRKKEKGDESSGNTVYKAVRVEGTVEGLKLVLANKSHRIESAKGNLESRFEETFSQSVASGFKATWSTTSVLIKTTDIGDTEATVTGGPQERLFRGVGLVLSALCIIAPGGRHPMELQMNIIIDDFFFHLPQLRTIGQSMAKLARLRKRSGASVDGLASASTSRGRVSYGDGAVDLIEKEQVSFSHRFVQFMCKMSRVTVPTSCGDLDALWMKLVQGAKLAVSWILTYTSIMVTDRLLLTYEQFVAQVGDPTAEEGETDGVDGALYVVPILVDCHGMRMAYVENAVSMRETESSGVFGRISEEFPHAADVLPIVPLQCTSLVEPQPVEFPTGTLGEVVLSVDTIRVSSGYDVVQRSCEPTEMHVDGACIVLTKALFDDIREKVVKKPPSTRMTDDSREDASETTFDNSHEHASSFESQADSVGGEYGERVPSPVHVDEDSKFADAESLSIRVANEWSSKMLMSSIAEKSSMMRSEASQEERTGSDFGDGTEEETRPWVYSVRIRGLFILVKGAPFDEEAVPEHCVSIVVKIPVFKFGKRPYEDIRGDMKRTLLGAEVDGKMATMKPGTSSEDAMWSSTGRRRTHSSLRTRTATSSLNGGGGQETVNESGWDVGTSQSAYAEVVKYLSVTEVMIFANDLIGDNPKRTAPKDESKFYPVIYMSGIHRVGTDTFSVMCLGDVQLTIFPSCFLHIYYAWTYFQYARGSVNDPPGFPSIMMVGNLSWCAYGAHGIVSIGYATRLRRKKARKVVTTVKDLRLCVPMYEVMRIRGLRLVQFLRAFKDLALREPPPWHSWAGHRPEHSELGTMSHILVPEVVENTDSENAYLTVIHIKALKIAVPFRMHFGGWLECTQLYFLKLKRLYTDVADRMLRKCDLVLSVPFDVDTVLHSSFADVGLYWLDIKLLKIVVLDSEFRAGIDLAMMANRYEHAGRVVRLEQLSERIDAYKASAHLKPDTEERMFSALHEAHEKMFVWEYTHLAGDASKVRPILDITLNDFSGAIGPHPLGMASCPKRLLTATKSVQAGAYDPVDVAAWSEDERVNKALSLLFPSSKVDAYGEGNLTGRVLERVFLLGVTDMVVQTLNAPEPLLRIQDMQFGGSLVMHMSFEESSRYRRSFWLSHDLPPYHAVASLNMSDIYTSLMLSCSHVRLCCNCGTMDAAADIAFAVSKLLPPSFARLPLMGWWDKLPVAMRISFWADSVVAVMSSHRDLRDMSNSIMLGIDRVHVQHSLSVLSLSTGGCESLTSPMVGSPSVLLFFPSLDMKVLFSFVTLERSEDGRRGLTTVVARHVLPEGTLAVMPGMTWDADWRDGGEWVGPDADVILDPLTVFLTEQCGWRKHILCINPTFEPLPAHQEGCPLAKVEDLRSALCPCVDPYARRRSWSLSIDVSVVIKRPDEVPGDRASKAGPSPAQNASNCAAKDSYVAVSVESIAWLTRFCELVYGALCLVGTRLFGPASARSVSMSPITMGELFKSVTVGCVLESVSLQTWQTHNAVDFSDLEGVKPNGILWSVHRLAGATSFEFLRENTTLTSLGEHYSYGGTLSYADGVYSIVNVPGRDEEGVDDHVGSDDGKGGMNTTEEWLTSGAFVDCKNDVCSTRAALPTAVYFRGYKAVESVQFQSASTFLGDPIVVRGRLVDGVAVTSFSLCRVELSGLEGVIHSEAGFQAALARAVEDGVITEAELDGHAEEFDYGGDFLCFVPSIRVVLVHDEKKGGDTGSLMSPAAVPRDWTPFTELGEGGIRSPSMGTPTGSRHQRSPSIVVGDDAVDSEADFVSYASDATLYGLRVQVAKLKLLWTLDAQNVVFGWWDMYTLYSRTGHDRPTVDEMNAFGSAEKHGVSILDRQVSSILESVIANGGDPDTSVAAASATAEVLTRKDVFGVFRKRMVGSLVDVKKSFATRFQVAFELVEPQMCIESVDGDGFTVLAAKRARVFVCALFPKGRWETTRKTKQKHKDRSASHRGPRDSINLRQMEEEEKIVVATKNVTFCNFSDLRVFTASSRDAGDEPVWICDLSDESLTEVGFSPRIEICFLSYALFAKNADDIPNTRFSTCSAVDKRQVADTVALCWPSFRLAVDPSGFKYILGCLSVFSSYVPPVDLSKGVDDLLFSAQLVTGTERVRELRLEIQALKNTVEHLKANLSRARQAFGLNLRPALESVQRRGDGLDGDGGAAGNGASRGHVVDLRNPAAIAEASAAREDRWGGDGDVPGFKSSLRDIEQSEVAVIETHLKRATEKLHVYRAVLHRFETGLDVEHGCRDLGGSSVEYFVDSLEMSLKDGTGTFVKVHASGIHGHAVSFSDGHMLQDLLVDHCVVWNQRPTSIHDVILGVLDSGALNFPWFRVSVVRAPPVGGIQVYESIDFFLSPMCVRLTGEIASQIWSFFFSDAVEQASQNGRVGVGSRVDVGLDIDGFGDADKRKHDTSGANGAKVRGMRVGRVGGGVLPAIDLSRVVHCRGLITSVSSSSGHSTNVASLARSTGIMSPPATPGAWPSLEASSTTWMADSGESVLNDSMSAPMRRKVPDGERAWDVVFPEGEKVSAPASPSKTALQRRSSVVLNKRRRDSRVLSVCITDGGASGSPRSDIGMIRSGSAMQLLPGPMTIQVDGDRSFADLGGRECLSPLARPALPAAPFSARPFGGRGTVDMARNLPLAVDRASFSGAGSAGDEKQNYVRETVELLKRRAAHSITFRSVHVHELALSFSWRSSERGRTALGSLVDVRVRLTRKQFSNVTTSWSGLLTDIKSSIKGDLFRETPKLFSQFVRRSGKKRHQDRDLVPVGRDATSWRLRSSSGQGVDSLPAMEVAERPLRRGTVEISPSKPIMPRYGMQESFVPDAASHLTVRDPVSSRLTMVVPEAKRRRVIRKYRGISHRVKSAMTRNDSDDSDSDGVVDRSRSHHGSGNGTEGRQHVPRVALRGYGDEHVVSDTVTSKRTSPQPKKRAKWTRSARKDKDVPSSTANGGETPSIAPPLPPQRRRNIP